MRKPAGTKGKNKQGLASDKRKLAVGGSKRSVEMSPRPGPWSGGSVGGGAAQTRRTPEREVEGEKTALK